MNYHGQIFIFSILKTFTEIVFVIVWFIPVSAFAQLHEDFADAELTENPAWVGDLSSFSAATGSAQLVAPAASSSAYISTGFHGNENMSWEFNVSMAFNPSSSNYTRVYLASDQSQLTSDLNGYYVMVGNSGDDVSLYKQTGALRSKIIDGPDGRVNSDNISVRIRVTRDQFGVWQVWSDVYAAGNWNLEGTTTDNTHPVKTGYFGFHCVFTSTRADKFFFDDITIQSAPLLDVTPPVIDSHQILSANQIRLRFSEPVAAGTSASGFLCDNNIGSPVNAESAADRTSVVLTFNLPLQKRLTYTLSVPPLSDDYGNSSPPLQLRFVYDPLVIPSAKDVIITEIFSDPFPVVGLPEAEFVELYNRGSGPVSLRNWSLSDPSGKSILPDSILREGEYLVLTTNSGRALYETFGHSIGLSSFPSLNNSGDELFLRDGDGTLIDYVRYSDSWFRSSTKKAGGWTLELIDPGNTCGEEENWIASENDAGGTPGTVNSVFTEKPDLEGPKLVSAFLSSADTLVVTFDEKLSSELPRPSDFKISPPIQVLMVVPDPSYRQMILVFSEKAATGILYHLEAKDIRDCSGNITSACCRSTEFAVPEMADSLDVIINEVLFNPSSTGVDFVEVVNVSSKFIDLRHLVIRNKARDDKYVAITDSPVMISPGAHLALTAEPEILASEYPSSKVRHFLKCALPPLNNDSGIVCLASNGKMLDEFSYDARMHSVFLKSEEGVSLERISADLPGSDLSNWKSAASTRGFATPGEVNSSALPSSPGDDPFVVNPEIFLPVFGQPDFARIEYTLNAPGNMCTVRIIDASGTVIKTIIENGLIGSQGFFQWLGDRDDGSRARFGTYLVWIQLYNSEGVVRHIRKRVVVAPRF